MTHASWYSPVEYFVHRFPGIFRNVDKLNAEFTDYQLLSSQSIPKSIKKSVNLSEEEPHRIDGVTSEESKYQEQMSSFLQSGRGSNDYSTLKCCRRAYIFSN